MHRILSRRYLEALTERGPAGAPGAAPTAPRSVDADLGSRKARHVSLARRAPEGEPGGAVVVIGLDVEARTLEISFSSEAPVARWFGQEVLSHAPGAADLSRLNDSAPLLFNHDFDDVLGVVENAWIGDDKRGHAIVRFGRDERGTWAMNQVADGILRNVSFMYEASDWLCETDDPNGYGDDDTYTARSWLAYEISLVSVPADQTVGVGRGLPREPSSVRVERRTRSSSQPPAAPAPVSSLSPTSQEEPMRFTHTRVMNAVIEGAAGGAAPAAATSATTVDTAIANERQRVTEITALGRQHNLSHDQVQSMVQRGIDLAAARGEVLANIQARNPQQPVASLGSQPNPDLTPAESRRYSVLRAVNAALNKDWGNAGFEREVSDEIARLSKRASTGGFFMPTNLPFCPTEDHYRAWRHMGGGMRGGRELQARSPYLVGTAAQGGNLVQTSLLADQFIDVLRNQLVTALLGARYLTGLTGNIDIPRQITQTGTYWVGESAAPTEGEATFDKVSLRPRTIGALSKMSRLMLLQATPAIEMIAREDLLKVMALGIDLAAISGTGASNQPTGIVNQSGVGAVVGGTNGANLTFDHIIQLQYATKFANAPQGSAGYALNSKAIGYLSTQKASTGQYLWDPQGGLTGGAPDKLKGRVYAESQQLRSTLTKGTASGICSELVYGNWQELFIAEWGVTEIMVNPYDSTGFTTGDVLVRAFQTCDIGVRHGASFAVMSDALTPGF